MKILSFDIGIQNLVYCVMHDEKIVTWEKLDISGDDMFDRLVDILHVKFPDPIYDIVLIENQPHLNQIMNTIQNYIQAYFKIMVYQTGSKCSVKLFSPTNKLKLKQSHNIKIDDVITKDKYQRNKQISIKYASYYLVLTKQDEMYISFFNSVKKKDDFADVFNMIMYYREQYVK